MAIALELDALELDALELDALDALELDVVLGTNGMSSSLPNKPKSHSNRTVLVRAVSSSESMFQL